MGNIRVMNENYISSSQISDLDYSSQEAAAPATNVYDGTRRQDVWRSKGYWNVTSSNNKIIYRDAAGVDKTATIAVAEYLTDATFLAAVDAAFEATGAANYTITRNATTNKIVITSDLSGGATVFQLMWTDVLSTAATILGFSTGANDTGAATYTADTLKIHTSEWLDFDLGAVSIPKAFAIAGARGEAIKLSPTATIKLQGNSARTWTSPLYNQTLTYDEECICVFDDAGLYPSGLRYWRLYIEDTANVNGAVEVAMVFLGDFIAPDDGCVQFPFTTTHVDLSENQISDGGSAYSKIRNKTIEVDLDWFNLSNSEVEELRDFLEDVGVSYPFWVCLDPNAAFSSAVGKWVKIVRFDKMPDFTLISPSVWRSGWRIREEI